MNARCAALLLTLTLSLHAQAQAPAAAASRHQQLALRLMEVTGAGQLGKQMLDGMLNELSKNPQVPAALVERVKRNAKPGELTQLVLPVYTQNLSEAELQAAIAFYETPAGKAIIQKMPAMMQQSMQLGQGWGMQLVQQAASELEAEAAAAPAPAPAPEPAKQQKAKQKP